MYLFQSIFDVFAVLKSETWNLIHWCLFDSCREWTWANVSKSTTWPSEQTLRLPPRRRNTFLNLMWVPPRDGVLLDLFQDNVSYFKNQNSGIVCVELFVVTEFSKWFLIRRDRNCFLLYLCQADSKQGYCYNFHDNSFSYLALGC